MHRRSAIDRYLAEGLPEKAEGRLRAHLARCEGCRRYYDEQVLLLRALAGSSSQPTAADARRMEKLALAKAGVVLSEPKKADRVQVLVDRLLWMPRSYLAAGAAAVLLVAGALLLRGPTLAGRVVAAEDARVEGRAAAEGMAVPSGAEVEVAQGGAMEIALERGGRVRLFPGVRMALTPRGEVVELEAGKVWCEVDRTGGVFAVRTDTAEARVLGTSFVVEKQKAATEVRVVSGSVEVEDARRRGRVLVKGGQKTRVAPESAPAAVSRYAGEDRIEWERLVRSLGRGFRKGIEALKDLLNGK